MAASRKSGGGHFHFGRLSLSEPMLVLMSDRKPPMNLTPFDRLTLTAAGFRGADQIAVAGLPLIAATVFGAGPQLIGTMVAAQGSAWLFMSLPAGLMVDRIAPVDGLRRGMLVGVMGMALMALGYGIGSMILLTFGAFIAATSAVLGFLAESASVQGLVAAQELPKANARLQLIQSGALLAGPIFMGWMVSKGWGLVALLLGMALFIFALIMVRGFGPQPARLASQRAPLTELAEGFRFVRSEPLLMGIVGCALFWNMAFLALGAQFVPYALKALMLDPSQIGFAQGCMGIGSVLAALTAAHALKNLPPKLILMFGPGSSFLAALSLILASDIPGVWLPSLAYFSLGFGPILWFVCQNTIRQLVTPRGMLGRVGSVIQVAIYGMRSVGALLGGWVGGQYGFEAGLWLVAALFALSFLVVPLSALGKLNTLPAPLTA
jgi:MFS family permease